MSQVWLRLIASIALGYVAWQHAALMPLLLLFPLIVQDNATPIKAWLFAFGYYLGVSHEQPMAFATYYDASLLASAVLWLAHEALLALPWAAGAWVGTKLRNPWRLPVAFVLGSLLAAVPPLGWIGYAHPLFVAGFVLPGAGIFGFGMAAAIALAIAWLWHAYPRKTVFLFVPLATLAYLSNISWSEESGHVLVFERHDGVFRHSAGFERTQSIAARAIDLIQHSADVGLLPEGYAGIWRSAFAAGMSMVEPDLARHGKTLLVGVMVPVKEDGRLDNVLYAFGTQRGPVYTARIPVPSSLVPWSATRERARPWAPATGVLHGQRVLYAICWETYLIEHLVRALVPGRPVDAIVAASNLWMTPTYGTSYRVQRNSLQSVANLAGIDVYWSVNFGERANAAARVD